LPPVELRPLAVSLNSFNGFLTLRDGSKLFYKTHVEPGSVIDEYYNTTLLAEAGYPIIKPRLRFDGIWEAIPHLRRDRLAISI